MMSRIKADEKDRASIRKKLQLSIDPLDTTQNSKTLVNIVSGKVAHPAINVYNAVEIGKIQMTKFKSGLPESFNQVIPKIVKTMGYSKKHIKHGEKKIFDTSVIFSRLIGLQASCRGVDIDEALNSSLLLFPFRCLKTLEL